MPNSVIETKISQNYKWDIINCNGPDLLTLCVISNTSLGLKKLQPGFTKNA